MFIGSSPTTMAECEATTTVKLNLYLSQFRQVEKIQGDGGGVQVDGA